MNKQITFFVVAILLVGVGSFYGGMKYGQSQGQGSNFSRDGFDPSAMRTGANGTRTGANANRSSGNFINGEVLKKDEKSITVKLRDGGSKTVFLSASSSVVKSVDGTVDDLKEGDNVMVTGTSNSDGSLTAQSVQIRTDDMPGVRLPADMPVSEDQLQQ